MAISKLATAAVTSGQTTQVRVRTGNPGFCKIQPSILFATASSFIAPSAQHKQAYQAVLARLNSGRNDQLLVVGHTDDQGATSINDPLSDRRATASLAVLAGNTGAWETIFQAERDTAWTDANFRAMLGEVNQASPNDTEVARHRANTADGAALRATLFAAYFQNLLGSLAASPPLISTTPATLACGEKHVLGTGNNAPSRRAEFIFVRAGITSDIDCDHYPSWRTVCSAALNFRPFITLASPIVVVKKPHTNPARQQVTLRVNTAFTGSGTFTRSSVGIRFFDALVGGSEILFKNNDNVFASAQLVAGVSLFAEGAQASTTVDDVQLHLSLNVNGQQGQIASVTMTALGLTLDVALSRPAPATEPPVMAEADKISTGRFVQTPDPGNRHERAMIIVRQTQPAAFTGNLTLVPLNGQVRLFAAEVPVAGQAGLTSPQIIANSTIAPNGVRFFAEGFSASAAVRDTGFQLGVENLEPDGDRIPMTVIQLEFVNAPSTAAPAATFARIGLWDNAFRPDGTVFNEEAEANNFVGADSRRFFIRIRDISQQGKSRINAEWFATDGAGNGINIPTDKHITLLETAPNSAIFISRALMLVTDDDDHKQETHSGLAAGIPDGGLPRRQRNQSNHRIRRATMQGGVVIEFPNPGGATRNMRTSVPVFQRNPEQRRRLPLQIFVLRQGPAPAAAVIPVGAADPIWGRLRIARETYARLGILVETVVDPTFAANIVTVGGDSIVLIEPPAGVNPNNVTLADETVLGRNFPALALTIRVFFTGLLASGNRGESYPETNFSTQPQVAASFLNREAGPYSFAHEIGHILTDKSSLVNLGHYRQPLSPAGNRLQTNQNLMRGGTSVSEGVSESKRLWDAKDADNVNQFDTCRGSHFMRSI